MADSVYDHDLQSIKITNCIGGSSESQGLTLPEGTWKKKLDKINKKVKKFNIPSDIKWVMSINDQITDQFDVTKFQQILSYIPPPMNNEPINIEIKQIEQIKQTKHSDNDDYKQPAQSIGTNESVQLIIHYNDKSMQCQLNKDKDSWDTETYNKLISAIKTHFNIMGDLIMKHQKNGNELDDDDDLRDEYQRLEVDPNFDAFHIEIMINAESNEFAMKPLQTLESLKPTQQDIPSNPTLIDDLESDDDKPIFETKLSAETRNIHISSQSHMIYIFSPYKCNKMEVQVSAISDGL